MNMTDKIIDVHHHIIPKLYKEELKKIGVTTSGGYPIKDWEPQDSIQMMDELGIEVGITSISEPATIPFKRKHAAKVAREVNEYQAELKNAYPGRFKSLALLPMPHVKETIKEIEYALDVLKLDGVGLLSNYDQSYLGDDEFDKVMAALNQRDAIVFVHPSSAQEEFKAPEFVFADFIEEFTFNTTRAATNLIFSGTMERYSNIKFILAHAGGTLPYLRWRINETLSTEKYVMEDPKNRIKSFVTGKKSDIAKEVVKHPVKYANMLNKFKKGLSRLDSLSHSAEYYISQFYYDTALSTGESTFASLNEVTDKSHILFGSDAHYAPNDWIAKMEKNIEESKHFTEIERQSIFRENASQIIK